MKKNAVETDRRRVKKLVEGKNFDFLIMSLICMDAVILGLMTSDAMNRFFEGGLFILDRLFMAIFIIEMIMKIFAFGKKFFKSGWNVFDFAVIAISSVPFASWFIIFRTFRLFRLLRYVNKFTRLKQMINTFLALLPNFMAMLLVMAVFFYVLQLWPFACSVTSLSSFLTWGLRCLLCCRWLRWTAGRQTSHVRLWRFFRIPGCSLYRLSLFRSSLPFRS